MTSGRTRQVVVIAGPNGAGKTTISRAVLHDTLGISEFVNADAIAAGLSGFEPERAAFAAGRVMLRRLKELGDAKSAFAFESTLASRTFAPWLKGLARNGYQVNVLYVWLRGPELAVRRVKARVRRGGHGIPDDVVRRRYYRSASNFWNLYAPLVEASGGLWRVYDNSGPSIRLVARRDAQTEPIIHEEAVFRAFWETGHAKEGNSEEVDS